MTCETNGATIWYKMGGSSTFVQYTTPIEISQDVIVQAYSKKDRRTSETTSLTCVYDDGIDEPLITCDGEYVEVNCGTSGADTYYRIGTSGQFLPYMQPFEIESTITVQAYATIDDKQSETVTQVCEYVPVVLSNPSIRCDDNLVIITCSTPRSTIYYRLGQSGDFAQYEEPFSIT